MRGHLKLLSGFLLIAAVGGVSAGLAQTAPGANPAPCSVAPQPVPCGTAPAAPKSATDSKKSDSMEKFPFPGEVSGTTASPDSAAPALSGVPDAPDSPESPAARKDFPFPGDSAEPGTASPDDGSSSSSSSSSSSTAGDPPQFDPSGAVPASPSLTDKGSEGAAEPGRHILHRVNPVGTKLQSADEREAEDLSVAHFYVGTGDLKGAYLRSQDAVKTVPDDPDAHFLLAEVALKLNKRDEAIAEYNACLKLDPPEKQAKNARKALARLNP